jgi:hypothetical protein
MSGLAITIHIWYLFENVMVLLCKSVERCQIGWSFQFPGRYIMEVCYWSCGNIVTWKLLKCALWINTILHFCQAKHLNLRNSNSHSESLCFWIWCVAHVKAQMALTWLQVSNTVDTLTFFIIILRKHTQLSIQGVPLCMALISSPKHSVITERIVYVVHQIVLCSMQTYGNCMFWQRNYYPITTRNIMPKPR